MANLLEVYEDMLKQAEAQELVNERVEFLAKYASAAEELLQAEYPNNYEKSDIIELADRLIAHDTSVAEMQEKTASLEEQGRAMAQDYVEALVQEFEKEASGKKALLEAAKGLSKKDKIMLALGAAGLVGAGVSGAAVAKKKD